MSSSINGSMATSTSTSDPSLRWWGRWPRSSTEALSVRLALTTAPIDRPAHLASDPAVDDLGRLVPALDLAVGVDADDGVGHLGDQLAR